MQFHSRWSIPPTTPRWAATRKMPARAMAVGEAEKVVERKKTAGAYGLLGLVLGLSLGLIGGLAVGSPRWGSWAPPSALRSERRRAQVYPGSSFLVLPVPGRGVGWAGRPFYYPRRNLRGGWRCGRTGPRHRLGRPAGAGPCPLGRNSGARRNLRLGDRQLSAIPLDAHLPTCACRTTPASPGESVRRHLHLTRRRVGNRNNAQAKANSPGRMKRGFLAHCGERAALI